MRFEKSFIENIYLSMQVIIMVILLNISFPLFGKANDKSMMLYAMSYAIFVGFRFYYFFIKKNEMIILSGIVGGLFLAAFIVLKIDSDLALSNVIFGYVLIQTIRSPGRGKYIFFWSGIALEGLIYFESGRIMANLVELLCDICFIGFLTFSMSIVFNELFNLQEENIYTVKKLKESNDKLGMIANTDYLTGLYNYKSFYQTLKELSRCKRQDESAFCMAIIDIDDFKQVNDTYGHPTGDLVLKKVAACISDHIRNTDFAARYGGEEFAILFPSTSLQEAEIVCERLRKTVENKTFVDDGKLIRITISIGLSRLDVLHENYLLTFIKNVDALLYDAKYSGKNRVIAKEIIFETC